MENITDIFITLDTIFNPHIKEGTSDKIAAEKYHKSLSRVMNFTAGLLVGAVLNGNTTTDVIKRELEKAKKKEDAKERERIIQEKIKNDPIRNSRLKKFAEDERKK